MLYWKVQNTVYPALKIITKLFDERENQWMTNQRKACKERTKLKLQKAVNLNDMVMWLLSDCKSWRGQVTSTVEILEVLKRNPDKQKFILRLRTELAYFTDTHKTEKIQRPDLFRQNVISIEEKLENFCILLSDNAEIRTATIANLPTNEDGFKALRNKRDYCCRNHKPINIWSELNVCCVSVGTWSFYLVNWIYHWSKWRKLWGWSSSLKSSNTK